LEFKKYAAFPLFLSQGSPIGFGKRALKKDASPEERHQRQESFEEV